MRPGLLQVAATLLALAAGGPAAAGAPDARPDSRPDDHVDWSGVSHVPWQDRRPLCPVDGEAFEVRFQTWRGDITAARLRVTTTDSTWVDAVRAGARQDVHDARGLYDIWTARIPATKARTLRYWIELRDGADTDYYSAGGMSDEMPADGGFALDFDTLAHAPAGATPTTRGTVFKVWAPGATRATVPGSFNGWDPHGHPMRKVGEHFIVHIPGVTAGQQYKYRFDDALWRSDPRGRRLDPGEHHNATVVDPHAYRWHDAGFRPPALADMVIYQLHVGSFAGRNDPAGPAPLPSGFADVVARIDHLRELGVNTVLLNPITEISGPVSGGYNPITQWAPTARYGRPGELAHLIDVLHQHGMAVLFDMVWNHVSPTDNFLWRYDGTQHYFDTPAVDTRWGAQADFDRPAVQDYYLDSALMWLADFHVDGFRMDATAHMARAPHMAAGWRLMQRFNDWVDRRFAGRVTIAEQIPGDPALTRATRLGGAGFDAQYRRAFCDTLRQAVLDAASGDPAMDSLRRVIEGRDLAGRVGLSYFQLHDEAWPANGGKRMVVRLDPVPPHDGADARALTTLAQGIVMLAPGVPAMLMGDEWLEDTDFGPARRIDWSKKRRYAATVAYYRDLIGLRRSRPVLRADAPVQVFLVDEARDLIGFRRYRAGRELVVLANLAGRDHARYRVGLPRRGRWHEVLNSQAPAYGGPGPRNAGVLQTEAVPAHGFARSVVLDVPRRGLLVLAPANGPCRPGPRLLDLALWLAQWLRTWVPLSLPLPGQTDADGCLRAIPKGRAPVDSDAS